MDCFVNTLIQQNHSTGIYLVEETQLMQGMVLNGLKSNVSLENISDKEFCCTCNTQGVWGLDSMRLVVELKRMNALVASWQHGEYLQFKEFVDEWNRERLDGQSDNASLIDKWTFASCGGASHLLDDGHAVKRPKLDVQRESIPVFRSTMGIGVIVYETSTKIGIVIRRNASMGIVQDIWRTIYPQEFLQMFYGCVSNIESPQSFLVIMLSRVFPQFQSLLIKCSMCDIAVSYTSHLQVNNTGTCVVPQMVESSYRSIGRANEPAILMLSRYLQ
jgi:hypothetical protein